ncbi:MAG: HD domain-containing protein [Bacillota bacterium]|nr:HD domain-containing protein [Bacillota bacterium]
MVSRIIERMVSYFGEDRKRINHALKVYGFSKAILGGEELAEKTVLVVELAAVLHDIGIKEAERKYNSSEARYQEEEGPAIAQAIMAEAGVEESIMGRVCHIIGNHHSYGKIDSIEFQIVVEADFIVNIFEDNMDPNAVKTIKDKYFKTQVGKSIIKSMYSI